MKTSEPQTPFDHSPVTSPASAALSDEKDPWETTAPDGTLPADENETVPDENSPENETAPDPYWKRINLVIEYSGLTVNAFCKEVGLRTETLYRIRNGLNRPSRPTLSKIAARYPNFSLQWLTSGNGPLTESHITFAKTGFFNDSDMCTLPFYRGILGRDIHKLLLPDGFAVLPKMLAQDAELVCYYRSGCLAPLLAPECWVLLKNAEADLRYHQIYYVETFSLRAFRILAPSGEKDCLLLKCFDKEMVESQLVKKSEVQNLYRVCGCFFAPDYDPLPDRS